MTASITREAALRLGKAARELGGVEASVFARAVGERLGLPLTETKLTHLTVDDLREILAGNHAEENCKVGVSAESLKLAVRQLWGDDTAYSELPPLAPNKHETLPESIRVACASNTGEVLDGHFGSCERFLIYQISSAESRLIEIRPTLEADHDDDRNAARAALIRDCDVVFVQSVGGPAAAKLVRCNIHPVKVPKPESTQAIVGRLQDSLRRPPPWLAKIMGVPAQSLSLFSLTDDA